MVIVKNVEECSAICNSRIKYIVMRSGKFITIKLHFYVEQLFICYDFLVTQYLYNL